MIAAPLGDCSHKTFLSALSCVGDEVAPIQRAWSPPQLLHCQQDSSCSHDANLLQMKAISGFCCAGVGPPPGAL